MESENGGVAVARGWNVKRVDVVNRKAYLEDDYEIEYGKCLIATGTIFHFHHTPKIHQQKQRFQEHNRERWRYLKMLHKIHP